MDVAKKKPWKTGTSSGHITNLKQSIFETLDIYASMCRQREREKLVNHYVNKDVIHVAVKLKK